MPDGSPHALPQDAPGAGGVPGGDARAYQAFAARLVEGGILTDPWLDGRPRFDPRPLVLPRAHLAALYRAAEEVAAVYNQVVRLCAGDPALTERYFHFTPWQRRMWLGAAPLWHGIARADVFFTDDGPAVCELNCDTPSGEAEAVLGSAAAARGAPGLVDPNAGLEARFCRLVERLAGRRFRDPVAGPLSVGVIYPTELTEDLSMIALYRRWLEARGARVTLGSPYNLAPAPGPGRGKVALFGAPLDLCIRHYKTDWLGERLPVRDDEPPVADPHPLERPLALLLGAGAPPVVNPLGAVLPQNKRAMALMWEELPRFPAWARQVIQRRVPVTARMEVVPRARLLAEKDAWVLKSDYGCEGAEVLVGRDAAPAEWAEALAHAIPRRFVVQRRFSALPDERGEVNHGVYLVAGVASGLFTRTQRGRTDRGALATATLIEGT